MSAPERLLLPFCCVVLLADPDARTHQLSGVPAVKVDDSFAAVRINPTGEPPSPRHPIGIVRWTHIEAQQGVQELAKFPSPTEIVSAACDVGG